ncbi:PTS glucose transporter subunit IIBC, partial [Staphylococcus aureus]|nr:PTS glucose transporter subunit IIBC [Staphylococcus aureus]
INPVANHPLMILVQGIVFFALYYFIFRFVIKIFNLNTIGRGDNLLADPTANTTENEDTKASSSKSKYYQSASQILEGLGGSDN